MPKNGLVNRMLNWLKEKLMKWLCIDKLIEIDNSSLKMIEANDKSIKLHTKWIKDMTKQFEDLVGIVKDMNKESKKDYTDLVKMMMMKSDFDSLEKRILKNVQAVQAIDMDFYETGKLILLQRVGKEDRVTIINIPPQTTVKEYRDQVESFERMYKAELKYLDAPKGIDLSDLSVGKGWY